MDNNKPMYDDEEPILSLIQQIKDGTLNPRTLSKDSRQNCVEVLIGEGYTESQVAQILQRSEKTIQRDVQDIRERNSLTPSIEFAKQIAGDIVKKGFADHDFLVRLSNSKGVSDVDKIQARAKAWDIFDRAIERLQSLGFMPLKPKEVIGDIYHHHEGGDNKTYAQLKEELKNIEKIAREAGTLDKDTEETIKLLEKKIEKAQIVEEMIDLKKDNPNEDKKLQEGDKNEPEQHT